MSRWGEFDWGKTGPKKPPPEHGIRVKKAGTTWWGQRWIAALEEVLGGDAGRLARGRTYARAGRTHDLVVKGGAVTARVTGSRPTPYKITLRVTELGDAAWERAVHAMAQKAQFAAGLLNGEMPREIDEVFRASGVSLFPTQRKDLETSCSCPDWGDPCKHVAATHYVLGEALDRDPFLLFELRGRTKEQVLAALRAARGAASGAVAKKGDGAKVARAGAQDAVPTVKLGALTEREYEGLRGPLPSLRFRFDDPVADAVVLRQLGAPQAWVGEASPVSVLAPLVRAAADRARRIAMAEPLAAGESGAATPSGDEPLETAATPTRRSTTGGGGAGKKAASRPLATKATGRRSK